MARTTISIPDEIKQQMDEVGDEANWSAIATSAFLAEINKLKARKAALKGKPMNAAIERLRKSKESFLEEAKERGRSEGTSWAMHQAEYAELQRLATDWEQMESTETGDAFGAPGVFLRIIAADGHVDRQDIDDFWTNLDAEVPEDQYSSDFWDGFIEGALEVFDQLDE